MVLLFEGPKLQIVGYIFRSFEAIAEATDTCTFNIKSTVGHTTYNGIHAGSHECRLSS